MTYRTLLVYLDDPERCNTRLDIAIRLAQQFDGHLVGLAATGRLPTVADFGSSPLEAEVLTMAQARLRQAAKERVESFREHCRKAGLKSMEMVLDEEESAASTVSHSHCSDLVVIGQADPAAADYPVARAMAEQVVLNSARPTLFVPYIGRFDTLGQAVLIAWNDSREAARAVADAMPLLCRARAVHLVQFETPARHGSAESRRRLDAVRQWLSQHGVDAQVGTEVTEIEVGNALLSRAADLGTDLIVTGAYGHARWTERFLGGTTRTLLESMTVPVLMSH